jgi:hypothetical protein
MQFSDYGDIILEAEELRNIVKGKTEVRKCPDCQVRGKPGLFTMF